jgi:hypothetical protein
MTEEEITEIPNTTPVPIFFHQSTDVDVRNPGLKPGPSHIKKRGGRTVTCSEKPR